MEDELYQRWDEILEYMKVNYDITDVSFRTFIKILSIYSIEGAKLTILIDDSSIGNSKSFIEKKYGSLLSVSIEELTGVHYDISYISLAALEAKSGGSHEKEIKRMRLNPSINPNYTFDTFIVGENNNYAHAASLKVAEEPGDTYNPLFIYGGPGLGKTHLMHAIANYILENDKSKKVIYVTSETFTNEIVDAVRDSKNEHSTARQDFRAKYRNVDVLLIDDIQFIIGKDATQLEFFHTFNHLYESQKQIVISSDKHPSTMTMLEERLRSRFEMGLTVDIKIPDYETRMAILRKKVSEENFIIDDSILDYIATNITSNIRELQGAIIKVISFSNLCNREINLDLAKEALADMIDPNRKRQVTIEYIVETVADHFGITVDDILSSKRNSSIAFPRHICIYLCREHVGSSLVEIGKKLGNRHHSTILHSIEAVESKLREDNDGELAKTIDALNKKINPD